MLTLSQVLIDRMYDIEVADPSYYTKYARYIAQEVRINIERG